VRLKGGAPGGGSIDCYSGGDDRESRSLLFFSSQEREREKSQLRFNSEDEEGMRMRTYMVRLSNGIWNGKVIAFDPILSVSVTITL